MISLDEFILLSKEYNMIPLYEEIEGDIFTPITIYNEFCLNKDYSYLLESVGQGEYSFIGVSPQLVIRQEKDFISINKYNESGDMKKKVKLRESLLDYIHKHINRLYLPEQEGLPPFTGGFVGYFSYEMISYWESIYRSQPGKNIKRSKIPAAVLVCSRVIIAIDHKKHRIKVITNIYICNNSTESERIELYKKNKKMIHDIVNKLKDITIEKRERKFCTPLTTDNFISSIDRKSFIKMIKKGQEYIKKGDAFQLVLSQRFSASSNIPPFKLYRALRMLNPSPYLFFFDFPESILIGSSPEVLVRVHDRKVTTRPLAGTRPRGKNRKHDLILQEELLNDEKEKAEHIMLVDLGRNDLGKICKVGSVRVTELMNIEFYSSVMHIVSEIEGELVDNYSSLKLLKSVFPAGTVTGVPKIRAIEIIDELEKDARGIYAGAVGYLDFKGNIDTCITIRTILYQNNKYYIQAGAGIISDSVPEKEYEETINKARTLFKSLEIIREDGNYDFNYK